MTPDRIREERLRCERCLDDMRHGAEVLLRAGISAPDIQQLGAPLSLLFRLALPGAKVIRRHGAPPLYPISETHARYLIASGAAWFPLARRAFKAALRDREILTNMRAEVDVGAALAASLSAAE